jgi:hypothetical protein
VEHPTTAELQQMARNTFGRELSAEKAEAYRGRLPVMVRAAHILQAWEAQLRHNEPAAVHSLLASEGESHGIV